MTLHERKVAEQDRQHQQLVAQVRREVLLELAAEFRDEDTVLAGSAFLGSIEGMFDISRELERRAARTT